MPVPNLQPLKCDICDHSFSQNCGKIDLLNIKIIQYRVFKLALYYFKPTSFRIK